MWHHIFLEYSTHFFEQPRSYNDTNMLERSFVFIELVDGCTPLINYSINGNNYTILEGGGGRVLSIPMMAYIICGKHLLKQVHPYEEEEKKKTMKNKS